jgi:sporulation integral membrane protein YtvI
MKIKQNWLKVLMFVIFVVLLGIAVYAFLPAILKIVGMLISMFLPFILGYLFSRLVNPLADLLQKRLKCPRGISALLVIVFTIGIIGGTISVIIWRLVIELRNLYEQFPQIYDQFQGMWQQFSAKWSKVYYSMPEQIQSILSDMTKNFSDKATEFIDSRSEPVVDYASNFAKAIPGGFIGVIIFILSGYFMVIDSKNVSAAVHKMLGKQLTEKMSGVKRECKRYLGGYVKAQFTIMCIAFVIMLIEFSIAGTGYSVLIAFSTAFLDALPVFGSGIVLWPLAVINFISGNIKNGIVMIIAYISVVIMRHLLEPKLVSSKIGMNPILTLMAMYIGYRIWGVGGIILGTIILMLVVSFYKAGIFDTPIRGLKHLGEFIKSQYRLFKKYIKKFIAELTEDNDE